MNYTIFMLTNEILRFLSEIKINIQFLFLLFVKQNIFF